MSEEERKHWLDVPGIGDRVYRVLAFVCGLLVLAEIVLLVLHYRHPHFAFDGLPGFYGAFGFLAFVGIVLSGKYLRRVLMRSEDYYDPPEEKP